MSENTGEGYNPEAYLLESAAKGLEAGLENPQRDFTINSGSDSVVALISSGEGGIASHISVGPPGAMVELDFPDQGEQSYGYMLSKQAKEIIGVRRGGDQGDVVYGIRIDNNGTKMVKKTVEGGVLPARSEISAMLHEPRVPSIIQTPGK